MKAQQKMIEIVPGLNKSYINKNIFMFMYISTRIFLMIFWNFPVPICYLKSDCRLHTLRLCRKVELIKTLKSRYLQSKMTFCKAKGRLSQMIIISKLDLYAKFCTIKIRRQTSQASSGHKGWVAARGNKYKTYLSKFCSSKWA